MQCLHLYITPIAPPSSEGLPCARARVILLTYSDLLPESELVVTVHDETLRVTIILMEFSQSSLRFNCILRPGVKLKGRPKVDLK